MTAARSPMSQHNPVEVSTSSAPTWMLDWKWHEFKVFETMHMSYMNRQYCKFTFYFFEYIAVHYLDAPNAKGKVKSKLAL